MSKRKCTISSEEAIKNILDFVEENNDDDDDLENLLGEDIDLNIGSDDGKLR